MPIGHDPSIRGWPWVENTHSWVEPTALSLLAISTAGESSHPRALEAVRLLMDRQLPTGGWNYGNTFVYGKQLLPLPQTTGVALSALQGHVSAREIGASLDYLAKAAESLAPLSLAWAILGLSAWERRPRQAETWLEARLGQQSRYGDYTTDLLSTLLVSALAPRGIAALAGPRKAVP